MPLEFDMPTEEQMAHDEGNYLKEPGFYQFQVTDTEEEALDKKGMPIGAFRVDLAVLAPANLKGKTMSPAFFHPKLNDDQKSIEWANKKRAAFAIATGLTGNSSLGKTVKVELSDAKDRQICMRVDWDKDQKFLQISYADCFHVDDPKAKDCPKDPKALALIPKAHRRDPASFGKPTAATNGNGAKSASEPAKAAAKATAAASSLDDV